MKIEFKSKAFVLFSYVSLISNTLPILNKTCKIKLACQYENCKTQPTYNFNFENLKTTFSNLD